MNTANALLRTVSKNFTRSFAVFLALLSVTSAQAQTAIGATWANTGSEWTNGASWLGGNAPTNDNGLVGNIATFSNAAAGFNTVNLSSGRGIYGLVFVSGANAYTFTGSALTVGSGGGISNASASLQTFSNKVINNGGGPVYGSYAGGSLLFAGGIDITTPTSTASRTLTLGGSGDITVSGSIASGASVTNTTGGNVSVTNTALTIFSGNNTYLGTTTVSSGARLRLGSVTALGATNSGTAISSGGALDLNGQTIGAEALTISGTGVSSSGVIFNSSASAATWSGNITPSAGSAIKATNGSITLSGGIDLNNNAATSRTLTLEGAGGIVVSGNISNSFAGSTGGLTIGGTNGTITLSGSNSYTGRTTVSNTYTLRVTAVDALSSKSSLEGSSSSARNPTLDLGAPGNYMMNSYQGGNVSLLATNGASSLNFTNTGTGNSVTGGSRTITATNVAVTFDGSLDISPTDSAKTFTVAGNSDFTFNGSILTTNTGFSSEFRASSTGRTTLNASNNYDGLTTVSAGATLRLANSYAMGAANGLTNTVAGGGALELLGDITVDGEILALSGTDGSLATLRNITNNNTYNGAITFDSGTNRIDSDAGTLTLSSFANTLSSSRSLFVGGAGNTVFTGRVTGTGSATLTKDGAGTLTLANTNNELGATGGVLINSGTLALGTNNALGATRAVAVNGGTLDIGTFNSTVGAVSLTNGTIAGSTGEITGTSYAVEKGTISAILGGSGALTKSGNGTVTLSRASTYSGGTLVSAGVLAGDTTSLQGAINNNATTTFSQTTNGTYAGTMSGSGALTKSGAGTLTLSGANTYLGSTVINSGSLELGSSGSLRFFAGASGSNNAVSGAGTAVLGGTFDIDLSAAATNAGSSWTLVSVASRSYPGSFNVAGFTNSGGIWSYGTNGVTYQFSQSTGTLSVLSTNNVSAYTTWLTNYPTLANTNGTADPDGDGFNNDLEFAFDGNPTVGTAALLTATRSGSDAVFNFVASTNTNAVSYAVQSTTNLSTGPWDDDIGVTASVTNSANQTNPAILLAPDYIRREFSLPATNKSFYRVKATIAP